MKGFLSSAYLSKSHIWEKLPKKYDLGKNPSEKFGPSLRLQPRSRLAFLGVWFRFGRSLRKTELFLVARRTWARESDSRSRRQGERSRWINHVFLACFNTYVWNRFGIFKTWARHKFRLRMHRLFPPDSICSGIILLCKIDYSDYYGAESSAVEPAFNRSRDTGGVHCEAFLRRNILTSLGSCRISFEKKC